MSQEKVKILVVEDEAIVARDIQDTLILLGYSVPAVAYSAEDAIERAREFPPDLILMDIVLRGRMDGIQAAEKIRETLDIPVVFLTAYSDPKTLERAKISEPFGYLTKPFQEREIYNAIEIGLYKHRMEKKHREMNARILAAEQKALEEARMANRAKDLFLAVVSHELRTPLTSILTWVQLIRSKRTSPEATERGLEIIEKSVRAQEQIINDLLDVSRMMAGKLSLNLQKTIIAPVIHSVIESVRPSADSKSIRIESRLERREEAVGLLDPSRVEQVIWNLLTNAIKFTPKGGKIEVSLDILNGTPGSAGFAQIQVKDTGRGIRPEFLPRLFDEFSQVDSSTTREQSGLGLGLSIVRNLVHIQGGTVRADSPGEGKGSTFTVLFPILQEQQAETAKTPVSQAEPAVPAMSNGISDSCGVALDGVRVLLVEDEPMSREAIFAMLRTYGAEVCAASSAQEALLKLGEFKPDILVSDLSMPGEDGYSLVRKVKQLGPEKGGRIPSVAVTAYADDESRRRALSAGFEAYVSKPVDSAGLTRLIADHAKKRAGG